jgi:hypothetical protein
MNDFEKSFQIIKDAIKNNLWEQRLPIIHRERQRVLDYYSFCPTVERIIADYTKKVKNVCFIHSCNLQGHGTDSLDNILSSIHNSHLYDILDSINIVNIGIPIDENKYKNKDVAGKYTISNISNDTSLFEIPTLKIMYQYSKLQKENTNVLYLHTKGITHKKETSIYNNVQDWIQFMLYYLVDNHKMCIKMLKEYDTVSVNYKSQPKQHWSGNFWWATTEHILKLNIETLKIKHDAEWFCLSIPNIKLFELHNSKIDHYYNSYKLDQYKIQSV